MFLLTPLYAVPHITSLNDTETSSNDTVHATTHVTKAATPVPPTVKPILPVQTGVKAQEEEQSSGMTIFFSLLVIGQPNTPAALPTLFYNHSAI